MNDLDFLTHLLTIRNHLAVLENYKQFDEYSLYTLQSLLDKACKEIIAGKVLN
jgi:hypothetical protein